MDTRRLSAEHGAYSKASVTRLPRKRQPSPHAINPIVSGKVASPCCDGKTLIG
jgi:hypothetical protein